MLTVLEKYSEDPRKKKGPCFSVKQLLSGIGVL